MRLEVLIDTTENRVLGLFEKAILRLSCESGWLNRRLIGASQLSRNSLEPCPRLSPGGADRYCLR